MKLITEKIVEELAFADKKIMYIDENTIITPLAKELARSKGIEFVEGSSVDCGSSDCNEKSLEKECETNCVGSECEDKEKLLRSELVKICKDMCEKNPSIEKEKMVQIIVKTLAEKELLDI